jgi:adenylate kinase
MAKTCLILFGLPGAGKGTQAEILSEEEGYEHISSGAIFRENLEKETELGKKAQEYINHGELVPDDITISMMEKRIKQVSAEKGFLLDGFPRTRPQAQALDAFLEEYEEEIRVMVLYIKVPEEELIDRLTGRLTCRAEGHIFHQRFNPPEKEGVCDYDGSELYQRDDDQPETVKKRIQEYTQKTEPLIDYYRQQGTLIEIDGDQGVVEVSQEIRRVLDAELER